MAFEIRRLRAALLIAAAAALASCASSETTSTATVNAGANRAAVYPDITAIVSA